MALGDIDAIGRMGEINSLLFELLAVASGRREDLSRRLSASEWRSIYELVVRHSLAAVCFAGIQKLGADPDDGYEKLGMDEDLYLTWMGDAMMAQAQYENHGRVISKLAAMYSKDDIGLMLLKGYGLASCYPVPQLRQPGDIDEFLFYRDGRAYDIPAWKRGDKLVADRFGVEVRSDSEHHTKFKLGGISVENHYDFINTRIRRSSRNLEKVLKELAMDHSNWMTVEGQKVWLPSDKLNSLFLLRHSAGHFASEGITLRHVLDWAYFVISAKELDWEWLWTVAKEYNMHRFLSCLNAICIEDLGFDEANFVQKYSDKALKERILDEIMQGPAISNEESAVSRARRWWQHRWKHRICYSDSLVSSFVYSVRANIGGTSIE